MNTNNSMYGTNTILTDRKNLNFPTPDEAEEFHPCVSPNDDDYLLQREKHLTCQLTAKWRKAAIAVSILSIICTFVIGITAFSISSIARSSASFGFAFDSLLDVITTAVVVWRFLGEKGEFYSWEKEKRACTVIGVCFVISAIGIFVRALRSLIIQRHPHEFVGVQIISGVSLITYSLLAWGKLVVAENISSSSVRTDGYNSMAGAILSMGMLMSSLAYNWSNSIWFLDASIALGISLLLGLYGVRLLSQLHWKKDQDPSNSDD